ncbi:hypothetical protein [Polycladidibacter stylochi]|uniref:hypothetical protein n=1 Tax=Polycladidibacter stylochi TaxID=1807766 RepID=UPI0012E330BD|nr:hypothetical protein [Pseudovibrio stylochi]
MRGTALIVGCCLGLLPPLSSIRLWHQPVILACVYDYGLYFVVYYESDVPTLWPRIACYQRRPPL